MLAGRPGSSSHWRGDLNPEQAEDFLARLIDDHAAGGGGAEWAAAAAAGLEGFLRILEAEVAGFSEHD